MNYSFFQIFIITTAKKFYNGPFKLNLIPKTNGGCCILKTLKRNKIKDQSGNFIKYCFFLHMLSSQQPFPGGDCMIKYINYFTIMWQLGALCCWGNQSSKRTISYRPSQRTATSSSRWLCCWASSLVSAPWSGGCCIHIYMMVQPPCTVHRGGGGEEHNRRVYFQQNLNHITVQHC